MAEAIRASAIRSGPARRHEPPVHGVLRVLMAKIALVLYPDPAGAPELARALPQDRVEHCGAGGRLLHWDVRLLFGTECWTSATARYGSE